MAKAPKRMTDAEISAEIAVINKKIDPLMKRGRALMQEAVRRQRASRRTDARKKARHA